jgi:hypothetical protein
MKKTIIAALILAATLLGFFAPQFVASQLTYTATHTGKLV